MIRSIDPRHKETRTILRIAGPAVAALGLLLVIIGMGSFFAAFGSFEPPSHFWCVFVGMPLLMVGIVICKFAFMGAVGRYMAGEVAPVGKDVVNYMADGTKDAVRDVAAAIGEGISAAGDAGEVQVVRCHKCNESNDESANFCKSCGAPLLKTKPCTKCGELNDPDARFCDNCGEAVAPS